MFQRFELFRTVLSAQWKEISQRQLSDPCKDENPEVTADPEGHGTLKKAESEYPGNQRQQTLEDPGH